VSGIEFVNVKKRFGSDAASPWVVDDVSFQIPQGTLATFLGPSGCGKTTTLRMIAGLEFPNQGRIMMGGRDVSRMGANQRSVSMMFQSYALFPHMTVIENVMYGLRMSGVSKDQAIHSARKTLEQVGLKAMDDRWPTQLSGGQQQRVALARALALEPEVLLFDEPLSNLDARLRRDMREEIREIQKRLGLTVAYVTHDQAEAMAVSDWVIVMNQGRIAQQGVPRDLYERPNSHFVAHFMGEAMTVKAQVQSDGHQVQLSDMLWRSPNKLMPGSIDLAIRPEAWQIVPTGMGLSARVIKVTFMGHAHEIALDSSLGRLWLVLPGSDVPPQSGENLGLALKETGVVALPRER
jgi:iron(III) transport system ATP-binding protein